MRSTVALENSASVRPSMSKSRLSVHWRGEAIRVNGSLRRVVEIDRDGQLGVARRLVAGALAIAWIEEADIGFALVIHFGHAFLVEQVVHRQFHAHVG